MDLQNSQLIEKRHEQTDKKRVAYVLRLIIGMLLIFLLTKMINFDNFPRLNEIRFNYLGLAFLLVFVDRFLTAYRWSVLVKLKGIYIDLKNIMSIYFKSLFLGLFLPSNVGGELLKGYGLFNATSKVFESFTSVVVERLLGLLALVTMCLLGFFLLEGPLEHNSVLLLIRNISFVALLMMMSFLFLGNYLDRLIKSFQFRSARKFSCFLHNAWASLCDYQKDKQQLLVVFSLALISQLVRIVLIWLVGVGLRIGSAFDHYLIFVPFIALLSIIPVSLAGLGVQEGAFVYLFSLAGCDQGRIFGMAVLVRFLSICSVLPGAVLYVKQGFGRKANTSHRNIAGITLRE